MSTMNNLLVGQSGGPTAVINSSLYGVITECFSQSKIKTVYGMIHGIEGFIEGSFLNLTECFHNADLELLKHTPAAYLGSCRYKLPEDLSDPVYPALFAAFEKLEIGYFLYIGGNDSMDTVSKLSRYAKLCSSPIRIIGIPKTIDNDLVLTDHTPGFGSAAKYAATTVREISMDSSVYHTKSVTIIELMGRHAGWITASSVLARKYEGDNPVLIYLPEIPFSMEQFEEDVNQALKKKNNIILCVSEGIADKDGRFICEYGSKAGTDTFGHKMLTGSGKVLEEFIRERFGIKVRSCEINVSQRCSGLLASQTDIDEAAMAGAWGVKGALQGETGKMTAFRRVKGPGYEIECTFVEVDAVCNKERAFPLSWISGNGNDIEKEFIDYVSPLIKGNPDVPTEDGLPVYCYRK